MRGVGQHQKDLIQATQDKILRALYAGGTTTFENLKKATVLSRRTLTKGLKRLEDCGLVETCKATEAETAPPGISAGCRRRSPLHRAGLFVVPLSGAY